MNPAPQTMIDSWPASFAAWQRASRSLGGGVSSGLRAAMPPHPLSFTSGQGAYLTDVDGHRYTDYVLGWGPVFLGHCHPAVTDAVTQQAQLGETFGAGHQWEYLVAELIVAAMPEAERVLFTTTGTEANLGALRLARAATGRQRVLKCAGHYHGWQDSLLVNYRGEGADRIDVVTEETRGQSAAARSETSICRFNDLASARAVITDPAADIAAIIVEPVLMNSGVIAAQAEYLRGLRQLCDDTGTVLIFDQVITGFRVGHGGAAEYFGVRPDLSVLAKSLGNGYPVAAIAGRADLIDLVTHGVVHAGTYNGNPVSLAAAHATLSTLAQTQPYLQVNALAGELAEGLRGVLRRTGRRGIAHAVGPVVQVALDIDELASFEDYLRADWTGYDELLVELLRRGQFALPGGRWYLSTAHTAQDVQASVVAFEDALRAHPAESARPADSTRPAAPARGTVRTEARSR